MSKTARTRALEVLSAALLDGTERRYLAQAPLMAIVEAVVVLDEAGLLIDPDVADLDPDAPIPYTVAKPAPPGHATQEDCPGLGNCHGAMKWCDVCGDVTHVCDQRGCDVHACPACGAGKDEPHSVDCEAMPPMACSDCGMPPGHRHLPGCEVHPDARKPCPECGAPSSMAGGCNNIDCKLCPF